MPHETAPFVTGIRHCLLPDCLPALRNQAAGRGDARSSRPGHFVRAGAPPRRGLAGITSEETKLLSDADFGAPTILTIDPLATIEVLDTTNFFFVKARISSQGRGRDMTALSTKYICRRTWKWLPCCTSEGEEGRFPAEA